MISSIKPASLQKEADEIFKKWGVRFSNTTQRARELSGGNGQKVILAREMDASAALVIAAQDRPLRQLDRRLVDFVIVDCRQ